MRIHKIQNTAQTFFYSNFIVNMKRHTYFRRTNSYFFKLKIEFKFNTSSINSPLNEARLINYLFKITTLSNRTTPQIGAL